MPLVSIPKPEIPLKNIYGINNVIIPIPAGPMKIVINFVRIIEIIIVKLHSTKKAR
jgi:hypothetical protein